MVERANQTSLIDCLFRMLTRQSLVSGFKFGDFGHPDYYFHVDFLIFIPGVEDPQDKVQVEGGHQDAAGDEDEQDGGGQVAGVVDEEPDEDDHDDEDQHHPEHDKTQHLCDGEGVVVHQHLVRSEPDGCLPHHVFFFFVGRSKTFYDNLGCFFGVCFRVVIVFHIVYAIIGSLFDFFFIFISLGALLE